MIRFEILGIPLSKQSARFRAMNFGGKTVIRSYQKKEVQENERNIKYDIKQNLKPDFIPYDCALEVEVSFVFPPTLSFTKKRMAQLESGVKIYKTTKPDLTDNLMKALFDAMQGVVYVDDSRICKVKSEKIYGLVPMIVVEIKPIEE